MSKELDNIRKDIDTIDAQLLQLLKQRLDLAVDVAKIKVINKEPVLNTQREEDILSMVASRSGGYAHGMQTIFSAIMDVSKHIQEQWIGGNEEMRLAIYKATKRNEIKNPRVVAQGTTGAFSDMAIDALYNNTPGVTRFYVKSFEDIFIQVANGDADYGIIPVENSTAGSVHESYDLILKHKLSISKTLELQINHCLLAPHGVKIEDIKTVYSHPQALSQCADYIKNHGFQTETYSNTAIAARDIAKSERCDVATIASEAAAKTFGLNILARNIQSSTVNTTRFVVLTKQMEIAPNADKISLIFALPHTTGSLYRTLSKFSMAGLNLTKLESRPIADSDFQYYFYLDFNGTVRDEHTKNFICSLQDELPHFTFLGNYHEYTVAI